MKIRISRKELLDTLSFVSKAVASSPPAAILENVLLKIENNTLTLFATDLEIGIISTLECEADEDVSTVIPSKLLQKYLNNVNDTKIELEITKKKLFIKTDEKEMELKTYRAEEFPEVQTFNSESIEIEQSELDYLINKVNFAVAQGTEEHMPTIKSLKFKLENGRITTVGTNTYRLAYNKGIVKADAAIDINIPYKATKILGNQLAEGTIDMYVNDTMIKFDINEYEIITRTIEGRYPDYQQVIPDDNSVRTIVNKNELKLALKRSKLFDENDIITLAIADVIEVTELNSDLGHNLDKLKTDTFEGTSFEINLNANYLLDAIAKIDSENVIIEGESPQDPCVLRDQVDDEWLYIVMPVRG